MRTPKRALKTHQGPKHQNTKSLSTLRTTLLSQVGHPVKSITYPMNGERRIFGHHGDTLLPVGESSLIALDWRTLLGEHG
jgi:hypothetical protein